MRQIELKKPPLESDGLVFHVVELNETFQDAPVGIYIENELLATNPVLCERDKNGIRYKFVVIDPQHRGHQLSFGSTLDKLTKKRVPGKSTFCNDQPVQVYADMLSDIEATTSLIAKALEDKEDPEELTDLVEQILRDGHELSCDFVDILRRNYGQYWLKPPNRMLDWGHIWYYSKSDEHWYVAKARDGFELELLQIKADSLKLKWATEDSVVLRAIEGEDVNELASHKPVAEPSFAEEMIYTALVDLSQHRIRSAVVHAYIAFEAATTIGLEQLLNSNLFGPKMASALEAVKREVR